MTLSHSADAGAEFASWPKSSRPIEDYAESVGKVRQMLKDMDGKQPGDPARAARAIIEAVEAQQPPLQLPLGQMAIDHIRAALDSEARELDSWARLSATAIFRRSSQDRLANISALSRLG